MSKKIIVVDDSRTVRQQVSKLLINEGFNIVEAIDGNDGIMKVNENQDTCLVITDLNMPNLNGLDMTEKIRKIPEMKYVPILLLTTESSGDKVDRAKKVGASGWLVKPFNPDQLVGAVKKLTCTR